MHTMLSAGRFFDYTFITGSSGHFGMTISETNSREKVNVTKTVEARYLRNEYKHHYVKKS